MLWLSASWTTILTFLPTILEQNRGIAITSGSVLFGFLYYVLIPGALAGSWIFNHITNRRLLVLLPAALNLVATVGAVLSGNVVIAALALTGLGIAWVFVPAMEILPFEFRNIRTREVSVLAGLVQTFGAVGFGAGPGDRRGAGPDFRVPGHRRAGRGRDDRPGGSRRVGAAPELRRSAGAPQQPGMTCLWQYTIGGSEMTTHFTDDEIDALGERLRQGWSATDREAYRDYQGQLDALRENLESELHLLAPDAEIASRTKRFETVAAKLQRRPDLSLSQVTDLAGCRIIASGRAEQQAVVARLLATYDVQQVDDKSDSPKFGYRAVHFDIRYRGQLMEIQVQTRNQFRWQQVSEQAAGYDISIKYGGGHPAVNDALLELSELAWRCDLDGVDLSESAVAQTRNVITSAYSE